MPAEQKIAKCVVVGYSVMRNMGAEHADMMAEYFLGIKTEQLHIVMEKTDLGSPETVIIHTGTNDLRTTRNLDFVMGEVATANRKLPNCRLSWVECCDVEMCYGGLLGHLMIDSTW